MAKKNVLYILIDGLRYDVFANVDEAFALMPNIMTLTKEGILHRLISNGMITQIAMPPLLTQTYPLDYDGVNRGIRDRPKSFLELFRDAGYMTYFVASAFITGPFLGCERGANHVRSMYDYRLIVERYTRFIFNHHLELWRDGKQTEEELIMLLQTDYDALLEYLEISIDRVSGGVGRQHLGRPRARFVKRVQLERALVRENPKAVLEKFRTIPSVTLHHYLGKSSLPKRRLFWDNVRIFDMLANGVIKRLTGTELSLFWRTVSSTGREVSQAFEDMFKPTQKPWFALLHYMDVHDSHFANRWLHYFNKLRYLFRLYRIRKRFGTWRSWNYDLALIYLDQQFGQLITRMHRKGAMENTLIVVNGDHGLLWDSERNQSLRSELGLRTYYEHLEVPLIISPCSMSGCLVGIHDSMSVSATLLNLASIKPFAGYRGKTIFQEGNEASICETVGRGNCDIDRRDIYFTITTMTHKLMLVLHGNELTPLRLYNRHDDPRELRDCLNDKSQTRFVNEIIRHLMHERINLLIRRGVDLNNCFSTVA